MCTFSTKTAQLEYDCTVTFPQMPLRFIRNILYGIYKFHQSVCVGQTFWWKREKYTKQCFNDNLFWFQLRKIYLNWEHNQSSYSVLKTNLLLLNMQESNIRPRSNRRRHYSLHCSCPTEGLLWTVQRLFVKSLVNDSIRFKTWIHFCALTMERSLTRL